MDRWRGMLQGGMKTVQLILSVMGIFFLLMILTMAAQGMIQKERVSVAVRALKGENLTTKEVVIERPPVKEIQEMTLEQTRREESFRQRQQELDSTEQILRELQLELAARQNELEAQRAEYDQQRKKIVEATAQGSGEEVDANFRANVTLFSKMEPEDVAGQMKTWGETPDDDRKIRFYLRALKPSLAAEVVNLLTKDAAFNKRDKDGKLRMNRILLEQ